jgi:hypothetical protein
MFYYCASLKHVDLTYIGGYKGLQPQGGCTFEGCENLETVIFNKTFKMKPCPTHDGLKMFYDCDNLKKLTLHKSVFDATKHCIDTEHVKIKLLK